MCHGAVGIVKLGLARHPLAKAFLTPTPPAEWLVEEVGKVVDSFPASFNYHYRTGLRDLANFNLDTGEDQDRAATHPGTLEVLDSLTPDGVRLPPAPEDSTGGGGAKLSPAA
jgi:hypothetical protein